MPWRIPSARCPRCRAEVRPSNLSGVAPDLLRADEDAAVLWPRGEADLPADVQACACCQEELRGLYDDHRQWNRELRVYAEN